MCTCCRNAANHRDGLPFFATGKSPDIFPLCCHNFLGFLNAPETAFINIVDVSVRDNALTTFIKAHFFQHIKKPANFSFIETNCSLYQWPTALGLRTANEGRQLKNNSTSFVLPFHHPD